MVRSCVEGVVYIEDGEGVENNMAVLPLAAVNDFVWVRCHLVQVLYPVLANCIQ
jgi:hypothetical protein